MGLLDEIQRRHDRNEKWDQDVPTLLRLARLAERAHEYWEKIDGPCERLTKDTIGMSREIYNILHPEPPVPEGPFAIKPGDLEFWKVYDTRNGGAIVEHSDRRWAEADCEYRNKTWQDGYRAARKGGV